MYQLAPSKKTDPVRRWNLPDRVFFGYGACHILAGVFLREAASSGFRAFWVRPQRHPGAHVYVSDGLIAFDYHGYSVRRRLEAHHRKVWQAQYVDWAADTLPVDFDLLATPELNARNMRGPDQYLHNPIERARRFLARIDHPKAASRARRLAGIHGRDELC